jgi:hypothetical protein
MNLCENLEFANDKKYNVELLTSLVMVNFHLTNNLKPSLFKFIIYCLYLGDFIEMLYVYKFFMH